MNSVRTFSAGGPQNVPHPKLQRQPRVDGDINDLLDFISRQPWGNPIARYQDLERAIGEILEGPELNDVSVRRRRPIIELRRHNAAQFAIIYAYFSPSPEHPDGLVSIRPA